MKFVRDLSVVLGTAVLTAMLAGPLLGPGTVDAVDEVAAPTMPAAVPVLAVDAFQLSLTLDRSSYEPGQTPVVVLKVVNGGKESAELKAQVRMRSVGRELFRSRMPPRPADKFSESISLSLEPGETRTLELPTKVKLEAGSENLFEIAVGDKEMIATSVTLPAPTRVGSVLSPVRLADLEGIEFIEEPIIVDTEVDETPPAK